jgi:hypothetical protein
MAGRSGGALELLKTEEPGRRFQAYHRAAHGPGGNRAVNALLTVAGVALVAVGIVALPAPGPGFLIIAIGGGLIARQSAWVARQLDRAEVALRRLATQSVHAWQQATWLERILFVVVVLAGAIVAGYWALFFLLRG